MRLASLLSLALGAALLAASAPAVAQTIPSPYRYIERTQSLAAFGGYLATDRGDFGIGPHSAPLFGATYTIRFAGPVSGELAVGGIPTERTVVQLLAAAGDSAQLIPLGDVNSFLLSAEAGLRLHLTGPRTFRGFAPYLVATGGLVADLVRDSELEETIEETQRVDFGPAFAVGIGAGTDWFLTERLALRLEARDRLWRITAPEGLTQTRRSESEWTNNLGVTLGAALYF
jgi:opacity protein-like surface antigen